MTDEKLSATIAGQVDFKISDILREAWQKVSGVKAVMWKALTIAFVINIAAYILGFIILVLLHYDLNHFNSHELALPKNIINFIIHSLITIPLAGGILMIALRHIEGQLLDAKSILAYFHYSKFLWVIPAISLAYSLLILTLNNALIVIILSLLFAYLMFSYYFYTLLIVERQLTIWQALEASRRGMAHHWLKALGFLIVCTLIGFFTTILTIGIASIWVYPWLTNAKVIFYKRVFGVKPLLTS
jgi:hypothetical protein